MGKIKKVGIVFSVFMLLTGIFGCSSFADNNVENNPQKQTEEQFEIESQTPKEETKILVAYFSCTGTTKKVAEAVSDILEADLYEMIPTEAYTAEDLDYSNDSSRTSIEQNDDTARPQISNDVENMEQYEIIFLGYPIWWGKAPRIISTFVESYDFAGKIIIPFCTSGGSGFSDEALQELCTEAATWKEGTRFGNDVTKDAVAEWIDELNLEEIK